MVKRILLVVALVACCLNTEAKPKVKVTCFKDAATAIKNKNNLQKSRDALLAHAADTATSQDDRIRAYAMAADVNNTINMVENEKLYLKRAYDTVTFYSSIYDLYNCVLRCDSLERAFTPDKMRYRKTGEQMLVKYRPNLLNGGKWHMLRGRYKEAFSFFDLYMNTVSTPVHDFGVEEQRYKIAYWAVQCSNASANHRGTLQYVDSALVLDVNGVYLHRYKADALLALGDTAAWLTATHDAMHRYTEGKYFFVNLMDYLRGQHQYEQAMQCADKMVEAQPDTILYRYTRCLLYFEQQDWQHCIEAAADVLKHDTAYANAWYNKGLSHVKLALAFEPQMCLDLSNPQSTEDRKRLKAIYADAREAMERYRTLRPDDKDRWAPSLYHIYLNLNMGKEFDEMEKILKK